MRCCYGSSACGTTALTKPFCFLLDVGCGTLLFFLLRRKIHPFAAGALPALLMLLGPSWQDILWPFQIGFLGSVAGGLGALVLLDRRTTRADIGACVCLLASIGCSGVGLAFLAGIGVECLWRRRDWRRLWIPALPFILFVVWYETIGKSAASSLSVSTLARSAGTATAITVGSLIGRGTTVGGVVAAILGVLAVAALIRSPKGSARSGHGRERTAGVLGPDARRAGRLTGHADPLPLPRRSAHRWSGQESSPP